uniref:Metalloprotease TIKI homolog n=1 Tax=Syphacia muris TaxID=451379 RepID=A0A0N5AT65_9BILA
MKITFFTLISLLQALLQWPVLTVSAKVKEALEQSDSLVVEVDVSNKAKVDALLNCMQMTVGNTVRDYLPQAVYIRLRQYLRHYRQNLINWYMAKGEAKKMAKIHAFSTFANMTRGWERRKPLWLLILLQQLEFKNPELSPPLDFYLAAYAKNTDKSIYTVETIDEQCEPLRSVDNDSSNGISILKVIFAINYTLSYLEYLSRKSKQNKRQQQQPALGSHAAIINHYQCGDMNIHSLISSGTNQTNRIGFSLGYNSDQKAEQVRYHHQQLR